MGLLRPAAEALRENNDVIHLSFSLLIYQVEIQYDWAVSDSKKRGKLELELVMSALVSFKTSLMYCSTNL